MSQLKSVSLAAIFFLLAIPSSALAKTFSFEDKQYQFNPIVSFQANESVRAGSLAELSKQALLGQTDTKVAVLDQTTVQLVNDLYDEINQRSSSAKLIMENEKVIEFDPGLNGQSLDVYELYQKLANSEENFSNLPVFVSSPPTKLSETNSLGINELVAVGQSNFSGSPKNRINNIRVGAAKFNNILIKPQEEFSFNKFLGDVDEENGFLPELVIRKIGLIPEVGGGLCQVSSTAFRAAMNAGLPITERHNHSFAVRYYAPQGTDATIYPGASDLKFVNDFPGYLLIRTYVEKSKLYFDFYSSKDQRAVTFDGPYQYDKQPDGSMKAVWSRVVNKNGEEKKQTFRSTYLSPDLFPKVSTIESSIPNPPTKNNDHPNNQKTQ